VFGNAAVKPVLPLPSRSETRIRIKRAFRGLFGASLDLPGYVIPSGTQISMGSSLDHRWVPKSTPQRDRLYRYLPNQLALSIPACWCYFKAGTCVGGGS
jgi:hypothetical protein